MGASLSYKPGRCLSRVPVKGKAPYLKPDNALRMFVSIRAIGSEEVSGTNEVPVICSNNSI